MNLLGIITTVIAGLTVLCVAIFLIVGPDRLWAMFGKADLGPVDFATLERRDSPNDALACPADRCTAEVDIETPLYDVPLATLQSGFAEVIAAEPRIERVAGDPASTDARYVQRSAVMRYPDTLNVAFIEISAQQSTLALYSRSQLGKSDLGANRARLERLLAALDDTLGG